MNRICLFLFFFFSLFAEKTDVLFHLHDAGETNALLPVIEELNVDYLILSSGISKNFLQKIDPDKVRSIEEVDQIEPKKVVTGVASEEQKKVLEFFREKGVYTIAFWDNLNAEGPGAYFSRAHQIEKSADLLFLPCSSLVSAFLPRDVEVVGHPAFQQREKPKLAVWIGGYGPEYDEAYWIFKKGSQLIQNMVFLELHHPKTGLVNPISTLDAVAIADIVICHQSTVAFQALSQNKPVLHIIPEGQTYSNLPIEKTIAKKVTRVEDFEKGVLETLNSDVSGFYELMGLPVNSKELLKQAILKNL